MGQPITTGEKMPFFRYDTPYSEQNSFRALLAGSAPLVMVFMSNFGHPVTREFVLRYAKTRAALQSGGLALVVRSNPARLAASVRENTLPYTLLCDAQGVLYEYLAIPEKPGGLMNSSLEAWKILREARKKGYHADKNAMQQMPLTLVLEADGTVLFCHYGTNLTDVPEDCAAMEKLLAELGLAEEPTEEDFEEDYAEDAATAPAKPAFAAACGEPVPEPMATTGPGGWGNLPDMADLADPLPPAPDAESPAALLGRSGAGGNPAQPPLRRIRRSGGSLPGNGAARREKEGDTHEFPVTRTRPLGPAKGYPQPLPLTDCDYSALEKTMEIGYFNDPYAEE